MMGLIPDKYVKQMNAAWNIYIIKSSNWFVY